MKKLLMFLFVFVMVLGAYGLYMFYNASKNNNIKKQSLSTSNLNIPSKDEVDLKKLQSIKDNTWVTSSNSNIDTSFQYPVNLLNINIDVKAKNELKKDYTKVFVKDLDDYKFFCLNEILRQKDIEFSYYKNNNTLDLLIFMPDETQRNELLNDFKYYQISYTIDQTKSLSN